MTAFLALAAALALATAALVARALTRRPSATGPAADALNAAVYRDQLAELDAALADGSLPAASHAHAREALRTRLAAELSHGRAGAAPMPSLGGAWAAALLVVVCAVGLYAWRGTPAALGPRVAAAPPSQDNAHALEGAQMAGMVERLGTRLAANPNDLNGWVMLGRSLGAMGRFPEAAKAYGEAARLAPKDATLLADYADILAMAQGRRFEGEPERVIAQALAADPNHGKSLALAGSAAYARQDFRGAIAHWERLLAQAPPGSDMARSLEASLAQARERGGGAKVAREKAGAPLPKPAVAAAAPARVIGTITIAPAVADRIKPGDTILVFARAVEGSRMPLAIARGPVGPFPAVFGLDDSLAMSPAAKLSGAREVIVEARISRSGSATPMPGDLRGSTGPVAVGRTDLRIEIATVVE